MTILCASVFGIKVDNRHTHPENAEGGRGGGGRIVGTALAHSARALACLATLRYADLVNVNAKVAQGRIALSYFCRGGLFPFKNRLKCFTYGRRSYNRFPDS
jgi:hypothetical protein